MKLNFMNIEFGDTTISSDIARISTSGTLFIQRMDTGVTEFHLLFEVYNNNIIFYFTNVHGHSLYFSRMKCSVSLRKEGNAAEWRNLWASFFQVIPCFTKTAHISTSNIHGRVSRAISPRLLPFVPGKCGIEHIVTRVHFHTLLRSLGRALLRFSCFWGGGNSHCVSWEIIHILLNMFAFNVLLTTSFS